MLQVAQKLCRDIALLGTDNGTAHTFHPESLSTKSGYESLYNNSSLIFQNGDAELWSRLCSFGNIAPIKMVVVLPGGDGYRLWIDPDQLYCGQAYDYTSDTFNCAVGYPAATPIGNAAGGVDTTLSQDNAMPWCVQKPTDPKAAAWLAQQKAADGSAIPVCPDSFLIPQNRLQTAPGGKRFGLDVWSTRGAINAGFSVFVYLRDFIGEAKPRAFRYNECELLEAQLGMTK
jgi:hypothetical protein